jgi:hypothetical protein
MDRRIEIANTLSAISHGWVEGYTREEIDALKKEHAILLRDAIRSACRSFAVKHNIPITVHGAVE